MAKEFNIAGVGLLFILGCGPPAPPAPPATLSRIESEVFAKSCAFSACHQGSSSAASLNLEGRTFDKLVNAKGTTGESLVVPGKPDESLMMKRLAAPVSSQVMPPEDRLEAERIELVRSWIAAGAKDD